MSVPSLGQYVWLDTHWSAPGEGPYTLLAKLLQANSLAKVHAFRMLQRDQVGSVNLLAPRKTKTGPHAAWSERLQSASLSRLAPGLSSHIAGNERFRYCPDCVRTGYQAAVCQIDGFDVCPLHGAALTSACQRCGIPTPSYYVERGRDPFALRCRSCKQPWVRSLDSDSIVNWSPPTGLNRLTPIHRWLSEASDQSRLIWTNVDVWHPTELAVLEDPTIRRRAVLQTLSKIVPNTALPITNGGIEVLGPYPARLGRDSTDWSLSVAEYAEARAQLVPDVDLARFASSFTMPSSEVPVPNRFGVPPEVHAAVLWRAQFEYFRNVKDTKPNTRGGIRLRVTGKRWLEDELHLSAPARAGLMQASWFAAVRLAEFWHRELHKHCHARPDGEIDFWQWFPRYGRVSRCLRRWFPTWGGGRLHHPVFSPIGVLVVPAIEPDAWQVYFAVA